MLTGLANLLTGSLRERVLQDALVAAKGIDDERSRAAVLTDLANLLTGSLRERVLQDALVAAKGIDDERSRAAVLTDLSGSFDWITARASAARCT